MRGGRSLATTAALVALLALVPIATAPAQQSGKIQAACDQEVAPAANKDPDYVTRGVAMDCACMSAFLVDRYGAEDAEIVMRVFAAGARQSREDLEKLATEIGREKMRSVVAKVGKFQDVGRDMDQACPPVARR